ncbi:hypothetical protein ACFL9S_10960 [Erwinia sp. AnSW2-5]|uniref:hypothetical protein n=1 Tax=Erwinia sp. AnSW2-5 TaxID=3367692 RepID=UPI0038588FAB
MKEKFTPGPWVVDAADVGAEFNIDSADGGTSVGITSQIFRDKDNEIRRANTQLIAAAPELLEALRCLKRELVLSDVDLAYIESHFRPHLDRASSAIKKALGESQ